MTVQTKIRSDKVILPDAPDISGMAFRNFRGEVDYPVMLAVIEGSKDVDGIERTDSLDDFKRAYSYLHNCDPYQDILIAEVDGEVIGYNRVFWDKLDDGTRTYTLFGFMLPKWRRRGIGCAMFHYAERRLREIAAAHHDDGPKYFQSWAADTEIGTTKLLESEDYSPVRYSFEMTRDLGEPIIEVPMPDGLEVRPVKKDHLWLIFEAMNEAFRDHWGHRDATKEEFEQWMKYPQFKPEHWKVAWDGDQVAGTVQNIINEDENEEYKRKRGYTENIFVRRPWRKRGLARSLLTQSLSYLKCLGMTEAALGVDAENLSGALRLYESVGFQVVKRFTEYRKRLE
ncbi:MAG: GNAT family N-acetyltransferase [Anaerolineaceae bacterium]|nr:MAG: GNAT family N-acetyltransferase [Anaerolineaceae bacterium]